MRLHALIALAWLITGGLALSAEPAYHLLVLTPETPVVIGLDVEFNAGVTIADNRRQYARHWFARLDRNQDGLLDADEARHVPSFGRYEDIPGEMQDQWIWLDTSPADKMLSPDEMLAHVGAAMGSGLSIKRPRRPATQTVILHPRLDVDGDGQVSVQELQQGLATLRPFDFDNDQSLSAAELQPFPRTMRDAEMIDTGEAPFVTLDEHADIEEVARRLIAQYGSAGGIDAAAMGLPAAQFAARDTDDDGLLQTTELMPILTDPRAELRMWLHIPQGRSKKLEAGEITRPDAVVIDELSTRKRLVSRMGSLNVEAEIQDARGSFHAITRRLRGRQFRIADEDRDDHLSPEEFGELEIENLTFTAVDADRDKRVSREEFDAFVELRALLAQCRLEMTVANETTSLFEALDTDGDYRLSPREFAEGVDALLALDRNGNGKLAESELVTRYTLSFAITRPSEFDDLVGSAGFNQMTGETPLPIVRPVTRGPEWFRKMDRNQDGDVTWQEFLGPRASFDRLDADSNGLIDSDEASAGPRE